MFLKEKKNKKQKTLTNHLNFWKKTFKLLALFVINHLLPWCVSIDMAELRKFCRKHLCTQSSGRAADSEQSIGGEILGCSGKSFLLFSL